MATKPNPFAKPAAGAKPGKAPTKGGKPPFIPRAGVPGDKSMMKKGGKVKC